jgi:hypothetical protein
MAVHIRHFIPERPPSWVAAALFAIAACTAHAESAPTPAHLRVESYRPVFQRCRAAGGAQRLAIRRMLIEDQGFVLIVDPDTLATRLARDQDLSCTDTNDTQQHDTRYMRAVAAPGPPAPTRWVIANGGVLRGTGAGSFLTADLCPSRKPLDRAFLEKLQALQTPLPVALAVSGTWLTHHRTDFQWLQAQESNGGLQITWVDHSYHHPYVPGRAIAQNFLLSPGIDSRAEMLDTEQLLIENGETPSVFFRFPGLISNPALMRMAADLHLIVLGAGAWLARAPRAGPGDVILVHANGNEPAGLRIFSTLLDTGKLPRPFRAIGEAP